MSINEIKEKIPEGKEMEEEIIPQEVDLHKRFSIPFARIVFGLLGVPLGIEPRRSVRSYGFVLSIFII
jgi:lipopolysaccharide export system permease protein